MLVRRGSGRFFSSSSLSAGSLGVRESYSLHSSLLLESTATNPLRCNKRADFLFKRKYAKGSSLKATWEILAKAPVSKPTGVAVIGIEMFSRDAYFNTTNRQNGVCGWR